MAVASGTTGRDRRRALRSGSPGYTLMELAVVVAVIAVVMAVALPQLLPAITFSHLEGSARHLANYGRAVVAQATLMRERYTLRIDLTTQEYWAVKWKDDAIEGLDSKDGENADGVNKMFKEEALFKSSSGKAFDETRAFEYSKQSTAMKGLMDAMPKDSQKKAAELQERMDRARRLAVMARARNVSSGGILDDIGPLFEKEFTLDASDKEEQAEEVMNDLLVRTRLPQGVWIESVELGHSGVPKGRQVIEVEVTPLGLNEPVTFHLRNEDGNYYTVVWDAITGGAHMYPGKVRGT